MPEDEYRRTAAAAKQRLINGNARFVAGHAHFPTVQKDVLAELAKGQQPYATIIGCSDSRVPPSTPASANCSSSASPATVISPEVMGSVQYAAVHLKTPLFVILGHEGCGAVQAALKTLREGTRP